MQQYVILKNSANIRNIANEERLSLQVIHLDVNDESSIRNSIEKVVSEKERIDVLVNNAGYGLVGAFEDLSVEEINYNLKPIFLM